MARRRSSPLEQLLIKMLLPLVIALLGYYAFTKIMQNAVTQQIAAIHAIGQQANAAQQLQVEAAQRKKAAAAQAAQAANEKYAQETQLRWEQEQARARAFHASYQDPKGCDNWKTDAQMVACVDQKNTAKREFDRKWDAGLIQVSRPTEP